MSKILVASSIAFGLGIAVSSAMHNASLEEVVPVNHYVLIQPETNKDSGAQLSELLSSKQPKELPPVYRCYGNSDGQTITSTCYP